MRTRLGMGATLAMGAAFLTALTATPVWADKDGQHGKGGEYEKGEYGHGGGSGKEGYGGSHGMPGMGMVMHASTGHMLRHMLKHEKEIGLNADQVAKLKQLQLDLEDLPGEKQQLRSRLEASRKAQLEWIRLEQLSAEIVRLKTEATGIKTQAEKLPSEKVKLLLQVESAEADWKACS